ncbi:biotin synthase BioB [Fusobacterium sp.]|uniref:biotin synthase BioB n=1 Tax=Fusobacterium sp. TaxID=68766 RepID=UPI00263544B6|nr:biotin synthase BioB [Fusobacterium sp.]
MNIEKFIDNDITKEEALELTNLKGKDLIKLFSIANEIREKFCGNKIETCTITNAKSGKCSEDCKFCAQSEKYDTHIKTYPLKNLEILKEECKEAINHKSDRFAIVTSGKGIKKGTKDYRTIQNFAKEMSKDIEICCSIGLLDEDDLIDLKNSGVSRFHSNIQTSVSSYKKIVATTHKVEDRIKTIKSAKKVGMKVCCGGIIGMGESWEDRIDMAFTCKELDVDAIPLNILNPIKGTPYGENEILSVDEILKTIAIYRIILKDKNIKIAAGRENILKDFMGSAFLAGANGLMIGGYLTVKGRSIEEDFTFIKNIKKLWEK